MYTIGNLDFLPRVYRVMHPGAELVALGQCPECGEEEDLTFIIYEVDGYVAFECGCGWDADIPLTDLKEAGFYVEDYQNVS